MGLFDSNATKATKQIAAFISAVKASTSQEWQWEYPKEGDVDFFQKNLDLLVSSGELLSKAFGTSGKSTFKPLFETFRGKVVSWNSNSSFENAKKIFDDCKEAAKGYAGKEQQRGAIKTKLLSKLDQAKVQWANVVSHGAVIVQSDD
jgi:hypothetical protein